MVSSEFNYFCSVSILLYFHFLHLFQPIIEQIISSGHLFLTIPLSKGNFSFCPCLNFFWEEIGKLRMGANFFRSSIQNLGKHHRKNSDLHEKEWPLRTRIYIWEFAKYHSSFINVILYASIWVGDVLNKNLQNNTFR